MTAPTVIKLGGSLLSDPRDGRLRHWCERLTGECAGRCIVVPGGGPYADTVRDAQSRWHFTDDVAHRMALRAMDQCGLMLCDLFPGFIAIDGIDRLVAACASGRTPVWLPSKHLEFSSEIPRDWTVTSDSLAIWLADRIDSPRALLVKSCPVPEGSLAALAEAGVVDAHLPRIASRTNVIVGLAHADNSDAPLPL